jgi:hypothetical protein
VSLNPGKVSSKYYFVIRHKGKSVDNPMEHLGFFIDEEEAAWAFDARAWQLGRPPNFDLSGVEIDNLA